MQISAQLRESMRAFYTMEELFDDVDDMVFFVKDDKGRYVLINRTLASRCGYANKADVIGKTAEEVYPPPLGKGYLAQDLQVLNSGRPIKDKLELQLYSRGVPGWCLTHKIPIRSAKGRVIGLTGLSQDLHISRRHDEKLKEMSAVIDHIRSHYDQPLRIEDLAGMASLSVYQLEQSMKRVFHLTAGQFIMHTRIDAARDMLKNTESSIADVAARCGFYDQSAFTRQFKTATGLTPSIFRRVSSSTNGTD